MARRGHRRAPREGRLRLRTAALLAAVAAVAAGAVRWYSHYALDDAFIGYRFAEHIAAGNGFVYNVGEKELGTTTPLFILALAALKWAGIGCVPASLALGIASFAGTTVVTWRLATRLGVRPVLAFLVGLAVATWPALLRDAVSGMETATVAFLTLVAMDLCLAGRWKAFVAVGAVLGLLRPDGVLILAACGLFDLVVQKGSLQAWALRAAGVAAIASVWFVFSLVYFGRLLPNSGFAKLLQADDWGYFEAHLAALLAGQAAIVPLVLLGVVHGRLHDRRAWLPATFVVVYTGFFVAMRFPGCGWYMGPLHAPLLLLAGCGAEALHRGFAAAGGWICALLGALVAFQAPRHLAEVRQIKKDQVWVAEHHAKCGEWLRDHAAPGATVAVDNIGYIGYLSGMRLIDITGLVQAEILEGIRTTGNKRYAIETRVPEYICVQDRGASPKYTPPPEWFREKGYREVFAAPYSATKAYRVWSRVGP